jgi:hypothetical protein
MKSTYIKLYIILFTRVFSLPLLFKGRAGEGLRKNKKRVGVDYKNEGGEMWQKLH